MSDHAFRKNPYSKADACALCGRAAAQHQRAPMDPGTLKSLIAEAKKRGKKATTAWLKHDNHDDTKEMEMWVDTEAWLQLKLSDAVLSPPLAEGEASGQVGDR